MVAERAWDLHAGCVYCGRVSRDLAPDPSDPRDLACRSCLDLDAGPSVVIAGVSIPAAELARPEASIPARARAVLDLVVAEDASPLSVRREGREMDRAVARMIRDITGSRSEIRVIPREEWTGAAFLADPWELSDASARRILGYLPAGGPAAKDSLKAAISFCWREMRKKT